MIYIMSAFDNNAFEYLEETLLKRIDHGNRIFSKLAKVNVEGIGKLRNKIKQELHFLRKIHASKTVKKDHLLCSNLKHLEAVAEELLKYEHSCSSVMSNKTIIEEDGDDIKKICIDLILSGGLTWIKVIAKNPKALSLLSAGGGSYGQKTIVEQAEQFLLCAEQHSVLYKQPNVIFHFAYGIESALANELEDLGIHVKGDRVDDDEEGDDDDLEESGIHIRKDDANNIHDYAEVNHECLRLSNESCAETIMVKCPLRELELIRHLPLLQEGDSPRLNLCVTTLIAYVSAITNGGCYQHFETELLKQLARWEQARPVKPLLDQLFRGRQLFCCQTAIDNFQDILSTLGGEGEKQRAKEFLARITIVEDSVYDKLKLGGRVKYRTLAIFGTSEKLQAVTVTANHGFIRSAMNKGIRFPVFLHESRALTEGKQLDRPAEAS